MDINLGLFSERLRRLLAGEEGTLPDAAKEEIQNLHTEIEVVTSWLRDYDYDLAWLLMQIGAAAEDQIHSTDLKAIMKEINRFAYESEKVIDTFIIPTITEQQKSGSRSKEIRDALLGLQSKIIDIKQWMQQIEHIPFDIIDVFKLYKAEARKSPAFLCFFKFFKTEASSFKKRDNDIVGLDDKMEELLDHLIEGPPQLSVVAVLDSVGLDKTAFAAEAYNSNYVKHYFDCQAWVPVSILYQPDSLLDNIIKFLMPSSKLSEVMEDRDYEMRKIIHLHGYLMSKRYLIVLDDVWTNDVWEFIQEILPDNLNGSRVLTTVSNIEILTSFQLENGQHIRLDLVPAGGPLRVTYEGWPFLILYHGSLSLEENREKILAEPFGDQVLTYSKFPLYFKLCGLYLSVFPLHSEISARQLYQLWIAEGFVRDNSEATAEEILEELIDRGFIQVKRRKASGTIKTCSFSSLVWPTILAVACTVEFIYAPVMDPQGKSRKRVRRFCANVNLGELDSFDRLDSYLHSFLYLSPESDHLNPRDSMKICKMFKFLRVLDLGSLFLDQYPAGIENLSRLRYLKLNIPSLKSLPSSLLSNLLNLYTLDMPSSYIDHTADDIWKLNKLRHLNFGLITLPAHPGKYCSSLENLNFISALHPRCCTPDILGRLPKLGSLQICGDLNYYQSLLSKSLHGLSCLESLKLVNESKMPRLSKIVLFENQFPPSLTHLSFSNTDLIDDPMPTLQKLPYLQVLKLKQNSYSGRKLACGSDGFPKLKVLHLKSMLWLEEWTMGNEAMPKLECLVVNPCAYLKRLPEHLWCMKNFKKLELWWPQPELRQKMRDFEDTERYDIQIYPFGM
ncbi:Disease resistance protein RPP13 [Citrus sinensis]|uniref:Disease resistance protein RPP13 n=1 Tax=Citrus sinensis TaxID=2711 RepID=A0ACB8JMK2_CITSI|nr:Disease resistance protein RPP13 [Citrus sinensis]